MKAKIKSAFSNKNYVSVSIVFIAIFLTFSFQYNFRTKISRNISNIIQKMSVYDSILISKLLEHTEYAQVCLVSNDSESGIKIGRNAERIIEFDSIVIIDKKNQCLATSLADIDFRINSGSIDTECKDFSDNLSLKIIERYGQQHLVLSE